MRSDDPYYSQYKRTCLNFRRSKASADLKCTFGRKKSIKTFLNEKTDCYDMFFNLSKELKVELAVED